MGSSFSGKQEFNLNVLDLTVAPGDYSLVIEQPALFNKQGNDICGLFSFYARITPVSEMSANNGEIAQSKCEVKEMLPYKIYPSEDMTKSGGEYFVNSEGNFYRAFENILYKKTRYSQFNPEYDVIKFMPREDAMVSLVIQRKQKGNAPIVKLYDAYAFTEVENLVSNVQSEASGGIIEESVTFRLIKEHDYSLFIYYEGEVLYDQDGQEQCEYYNAYLSISTMEYLIKDMTCIEGASIKSFSRDLPEKISRTGSNDEYNFKEFMELKYP